jgi:hypothetical protein
MFHEFAAKRICMRCNEHVCELKRKWLWNAKARKALRFAKQCVKDSQAQPTPFDQALAYATEEWDLWRSNLVMKTTREHLADLLRGRLETITATEFRRHIGDCLDQAAAGKSFCIKRKGEIVAFLVHADNADVSHVIEADGSCETLQGVKG